MLGNDYFYHALSEKATALIGTLFNDIVIQRTDSDGAITTLRVPLTHGPREKFLARLEGDPDLDKKASIILPRIGFELTNIQYAPTRKLNTINVFRQPHREGDKTRYEKVWQPVPYDLEYEVTILAERRSDAMKVMEQVLPFFAPDWTPTCMPMDDVADLKVDVPITLTGTSIRDSYTPDFKERRWVEVDMGLTVAWNYYGPVTSSKVIKFVQVDFHADTAANTPDAERVTVQPGLTANGEPTTRIEDTIPYEDIDSTDPYGYVVQIYSEGEL